MWKRVAVGFLFSAWMMTALPAAEGRPPRIGDPAPAIKGSQWINSPPLAATDLAGKVVLVEFWTYG